MKYLLSSSVNIHEELWKEIGLIGFCVKGEKVIFRKQTPLRFGEIKN
jgi:hypothetical protein